EEESDALASIIPAPGRGASFPWLRIALSAALLAAAVGYGLAGWNGNLGPFRSAVDPVFALPEFRLDESDPQAAAKREIGAFLLAQGAAQSLRLLPLLEHPDRETWRREIEPWLRHLFENGDAAAARSLGFLAIATGEPTGAAEEWFLQAARKGDAESGYHYAARRWDAVKQSLPDPETSGYLNQAAAGGHPAARELLAHVLAGAGDFAGAFESMKRSAGQGWPPAIHQLGIFHAGGL